MNFPINVSFKTKIDIGSQGCRFFHSAKNFLQDLLTHQFNIINT